MFEQNFLGACQKTCIYCLPVQIGSQFHHFHLHFLSCCINYLNFEGVLVFILLPEDKEYLWIDNSFTWVLLWSNYNTDIDELLWKVLNFWVLRQVLQYAFKGTYTLLYEFQWINFFFWIDNGPNNRYSCTFKLSLC